MRQWTQAGRRLVLKARFAVGGARDSARAVLRSRRPTLPLERVHRRLELLLTAMYGHPISISPAEVKTATWVERAADFLSGDPRKRESTPGIDGQGIQLPESLTARDGEDAAIARYRLLAIEQAERLRRGTAKHAPLRDAIERDLYLLREGMMVDATIARMNPGLSGALDAERSAALARRPKLDKLTRPERDVELLLREALAQKPVEVSESGSDAASSLAWARAEGAKIRQGRGSYRGLPPASLWGIVRASGDSPEGDPDALPREPKPPVAGITPPASSTGWHKSHSHDAREGIAHDQSADSVGTTLTADAPHPSDVTDDEGGEATDEISSRPTDDSPRAYSGNAGLSLDEIVHQVPDDEANDGLPPAILFDEWDEDAGRYRSRAASVRMFPPVEREEKWSSDVLQRHAAIVRQVRHRFERLRARRMLLGRQRAGDELDIAACVNAIVDRHTGLTPDDRLYLDARPARRGLAISLLVDASGSTDTFVTDEWRIIDLERIALLLASEALDALGDLYAVHTFAGKTVNNISLTTIKSFSERNGSAVRRRIAGIEPSGFTRMGAAVRHATLQLARQSAGHRLLLILSDGRPNDVDEYQGSYGVEDSRRAIMEARASGVFPFCLTIDQDASEYLPRIFGVTGHTILQRPEQLPRALVGVVRALIGRQ
jgi:nitric oxide reductase NorD protein